ncbi:MAG: outer membrane protein assembly factor BamA [Deltaproteobacteria bacterium]|nr:outer membrane protein assembly factor BamA [Deltaproteobacteria bacterium]
MISLIWVLSQGGKLWAAQTVVELDLEGNSKVESASILKQLRIQKGQAFSEDRAHEDLKKIYGMGVFSEAEVEKKEVSGGVKIIYRVKENPLVSKITFEGNKDLSSTKILEVVTQKSLQPLNEKKVGETKEKIKELYTKEGMGFALIEAEIKPDTSQKNEVELHFRLSENKKMKVKKISFSGNSVFSERKLRSLMKTKKKGILSFLSGSGKYKEEMVERDVAFLAYQYLNTGYLKVQVEKPEIIPLGGKKGGIELHFNITEGNRYRVRDIKLQGDVLTTPDELLGKFDKVKGTYYCQKVIEDDLQKLTELYGNQGYAFANIRPKPLPIEESKEVDLELDVDKGEKLSVERVNITGNTITRDKVIRRELKVTENSLYNESLVKESKKRLEALGYFETVDFSTPKGSGEDKLNLNINVKEKPTGTFSIGAGYSSAESFMLTGSISKQNFMGFGISGAVNAEFSKLRQLFTVQMLDPYFLDTRWMLSSSASKMLVRYTDFDRDSYGGELRLGHHLFDNSSVSLGYKIEEVSVNNFSAIVPDFFRQNASGLTSSLLFSLDRDTRNNRITATKGSYNLLTLEYAGVGGDNKFLRVDANSRWFLPAFPKKTVLKANARIGYIKSLDDKPVPLFERYFTGGINSLRGFDPRSVGPSLMIPLSPTGGDETFVYGGNKSLLFNLEYEFPIYDGAGFKGVVFLDAGNTFAENENYSLKNLRTDWGVGFRWISPFGPLRFEWGFPFNRKENEKSKVFNFTIGTFF